jgi:hypothetical protein
MATSPIANALAEEVLRRIYGDDLLGCTVSLDDIAGIIEEGLKQERALNHELVEMYEKAIEAVDLMSRPPQAIEIPRPEQLRSILSDRLDGIQQLARKVMDTTSRLQKPGGE